MEFTYTDERPGSDSWPVIIKDRLFAMCTILFESLHSRNQEKLESILSECLPSERYILLNCRRTDSDNGEFPLYIACCSGDIEIVKILITHGVDKRLKCLDSKKLNS